MKKLIFALLFISTCLLASCAKAEPNVTFTAVIESVYDNSIMVTTSDSAAGFDKASVGFDKYCEISFNLLVGQTVEITMLPQIRESYPVQVTAVSVNLISVGESVVYQKISSDEAAVMMQGDAIILDVRTAEEYGEGHIQDAVLLPHDQIAEKAAGLLPDKDAPILVYCRTGRRSEIAANELILMGYTAVYDFGGIATD